MTKVPNTAAQVSRRRLGVSHCMTNSTPLLANQHKLAFISILRDRYVPSDAYSCAMGPVPHDHSSLCTDWITTACELATNGQENVAQHSLLALSCSLVAAEKVDVVVRNAGLMQYSDAVVGIRAKLAGHATRSEQEADLLLVTGLACAMYGVSGNQSFEELMSHLKGVGAMLQKRGVEGLKTKMGRRCLYEYRAMRVSISVCASNNLQH